MMSLKPLSLAVAGAALIGIAGLTPAWAQMAPYPQTAAPYPQTENPYPQAAAPTPQMGGPDQLVTNGPQANVESQSPNWSARQNVIQSQRYTRLVETDPAFRRARMRQECGPITDPQLHANCIASFAQYDPTIR
jgi:hypothetical protein